MSAYRDLLDQYVERYNESDLDGVMALYAEDAVQVMPDGTYEGWENVRDRLAQELDGFTELNHTVRSFIEEGDTFADEWTFVGTHTGPFRMPDGRELAPTGKRVEIRGMEVVKVRDGKIVLNALYYDNLASMAQLGLLPEGAIA